VAQEAEKEGFTLVGSHIRHKSNKFDAQKCGESSEAQKNVDMCTPLSKLWKTEMRRRANENKIDDGRVQDCNGTLEHLSH